MLTLSLRSTRRLCTTSSAAATATATATNNNNNNNNNNHNHANLVVQTPKKPLLKELEPPALDRIKAERDPHKLFHLFRSNATDRFLFENRFAFDDTVSRLAGAKRFDYIEHLLEHQKTLPQSRREGFVVRIITLYGKAGMHEHALNTFYQMHTFPCRRTVKSFNATLKVLAQTRDFDSILRFLEHATSEFHIQLDIFSVNIVIKAFCEVGKLQEAYLFMLETEKNGKGGVVPDVVTYTTLISAFYKHGRFEIGNGLWNCMVLKGVMPNLATFNARVQFLVCVGRAWDANSVMDLMWRVGVVPDEVTFNLVIKGFFLADYVEMAMRVYSALHGKGYKPNAKIYQTMIHYLCKREDFKVAYTMCKDSMQKNWFPNEDTIYMLLEGLKRNEEICKAKFIVALARRRKPSFSSTQLAAMQSIVFGH